jgi:hypothetical protein
MNKSAIPQPDGEAVVPKPQILGKRREKKSSGVYPV